MSHKLSRADAPEPEDQRAAIYCRTSIKKQKEACLAYCAEQNSEVVGVYVDRVLGEDTPNPVCDPREQH